MMSESAEVMVSHSEEAVDAMSILEGELERVALTDSLEVFLAEVAMQNIVDVKQNRANDEKM